MTAFTFTAFGQSSSLPAGVKKIISVEGITEYRLPNGLQILLFPDKSTQTATVNIIYRGGSRHEGYGETGMAHLLEHLVFKGTPKYTNIPQEITRRGMSPNGTTSYDRTNYFATFPATGDNLEFYLDMEADRMINSFIAKKDLDSEFSVVRNEMENGENNPSRVLSQSLMATAYMWHNYGKYTIGARSDVENVKIENLQAFYRKYYQPDNATLVVCGNFDEAKTLELINQKYAVIPKPSRVLEPTWTTEPPQSGERQVIIRRSGDSQIVVAGYHIPPASDADVPVLAMIDRIMADSPSGRLYKSLIETKKATNLIGGVFQQKESGFTLFGATLKKDQSIDAAQEALLETVENFASAPPTKDEVERQKLVLLRAAEGNLNDANLFSNLITEWVARGDWRLFFLYRERLKKLANYVKPETKPRSEPTMDPNSPVVKRLVAIFRMQRLLGEEGPAVLVENSLKGSGGAVMVHNANMYPPSDPNILKTLTGVMPWSKQSEPHLFPSVTMANEDYDRLVRLIEQGVMPKMTVDINAQYHDEDMVGYNTIAEISGTDPKLKDEIVMLGAHLDSWHSGTGATDNAAGSGAMMEAVRILWLRD